MSLPRCVHGNEGAIDTSHPFHDVLPVCEINTKAVRSEMCCDCAVSAPTREAAIRAWAALCGAVTDERLREIVEREIGYGDAYQRNDVLRLARAVRDACEGKQ